MPSAERSTTTSPARPDRRIHRRREGHAAVAIGDRRHEVLRPDHEQLLGRDGEVGEPFEPDQSVRALQRLVVDAHDRLEVVLQTTGQLLERHDPSFGIQRNLRAGDGGDGIIETRVVRPFDAICPITGTQLTGQLGRPGELGRPGRGGRTSRC